MKADTVFWSSVAVLVMVLMTFFAAIMWHAEINERMHLEWCSEELEIGYDSITQCFIDDQGNYKECFLADWQDIQTLYSKHGC